VVLVPLKKSQVKWVVLVGSRRPARGVRNSLPRRRKARQVLQRVWEKSHGWAQKRTSRKRNEMMAMPDCFHEG